MGVKCLICPEKDSKICYDKSHFYFCVDVFQECLIDLNGGMKAWKRTEPEIRYTLKQYLHFISQNLVYGQSFHIATAFIYAIQLSMKCKSCLHQGNIHRIMLTCCLIASKQLDDVPFTNKYWSKCTQIDGSFTLKTINEMEVELLMRLKFKVSPCKKLFESIVKQLQCIRSQVWYHEQNEDAMDYRKRVVNTLISLFY